MFLQRNLLLSMLILLNNTTMPLNASAQKTSKELFMLIANDLYTYCKEQPAMALMQATIITVVIADIVKKVYNRCIACKNHSTQCEIEAIMAQAYCRQIPMDTDKVSPSMFEQLWQDPYTLSDDAYLCLINFKSCLPDNIIDIALQAAHELGIAEPLIFYETTMNSHARTLLLDQSGKSFLSIGLHLKNMLPVHPKYQHICTNQPSFYRILYHELCHLKEKHELKVLGCADLSPKEQSFIELYCEMIAELGAMYYLYKKYGVPCIVTYEAAQEGHPTHVDQTRYNRMLFNELERNPDTDYALVKKLALDYLHELAGDDRLDAIIHMDV